MAMTQLFNATHFSEFQPPQATTKSMGVTDNSSNVNSTKHELQNSRSTSPSSGAEDCSTASSLCTSQSSNTSNGSTSTGCTNNTRCRSGSVGTIGNGSTSTQGPNGQLYQNRGKLPTMSEEKEDQTQPSPLIDQTPQSNQVNNEMKSTPVEHNNVNAAPFVPKQNSTLHYSQNNFNNSGNNHQYNNSSYTSFQQMGSSNNNNNNSNGGSSDQIRNHHNHQHHSQQQHHHQQDGPQGGGDRHHEQSSNSNHNGNHPKRDSSQNNLYKTELCRSFIETGSCRYGSKCQFAHGHDELRNLHRHPKYKTEMCKSFHMTGICPYGSRCHFIHDQLNGESTPRASPSSFTGQSDSSSDRSNNTATNNNQQQPPTRVSPFSSNNNFNQNQNYTSGNTFAPPPTNAWGGSGLSMAQKIRGQQGNRNGAGNNTRTNSSGFFGSLSSNNSNSMPNFMHKSDGEFQGNGNNWSNVVRESGRGQQDQPRFQNYENGGGNNAFGGSKVKFDMGWPSNDDESARNSFMNSNYSNEPPMYRHSTNNGHHHNNHGNNTNNHQQHHRDVDWSSSYSRSESKTNTGGSSIFSESMFSNQCSFDTAPNNKTTPWSTNVSTDRNTIRSRNSESLSIFDSTTTTQQQQPKQAEDFNPASFLEDMFKSIVFTEKDDNNNQAKTNIDRTEQQHHQQHQYHQPGETSLLFNNKPTTAATHQLQSSNFASVFMSSEQNNNNNNNKKISQHKSRLPCFQELADNSM